MQTNTQRDAVVGAMKFCLHYSYILLFGEALQSSNCAVENILSNRWYKTGDLGWHMLTMLDHCCFEQPQQGWLMKYVRAGWPLQWERSRCKAFIYLFIEQIYIATQFTHRWLWGGAVWVTPEIELKCSTNIDFPRLESVSILQWCVTPHALQ